MHGYGQEIEISFRAVDKYASWSRDVRTKYSTPKGDLPEAAS